MPGFPGKTEPEGHRPSSNWRETVDRARKEQVVSELGQIFESSGVVVVAQYAGLTVADMEDFRGRMRAAGGAVRVAKNRLAKIALKDRQCEGIAAYLNGMTVLAYSEDPVTAAKVVEDYAKANRKLVVLGGAMGKSVLDPSGVKSVAAMPSREELLASIVGCILAPAAQVAAAVGAPASGIASILSTIEERQSEAAAA